MCLEPFLFFEALPSHQEGVKKKEAARDGFQEGRNVIFQMCLVQKTVLGEHSQRNIARSEYKDQYLSSDIYYNIFF